jgi:hypothetical protein
VVLELWIAGAPGPLLALGFLSALDFVYSGVLVLNNANCRSAHHTFFFGGIAMLDSCCK